MNGLERGVREEVELLSTTAGVIFILHRRTFYRTVRTKDTAVAWLRTQRERQKVGGPVSAALGRTARRIPRKINRLKGTVADLPRL